MGIGSPAEMPQELLLLFLFSPFKAKQTKKLALSSPGKIHWQSWCIQTHQNDAFLSCSKIYRVSTERDCNRGTKCGNVLCFPKWLCFSVPGDPVVVPSGTRGPGAWDRGSQLSGSHGLQLTEPLQVTFFVLACLISARAQGTAHVSTGTYAVL